MEHGSKDDREHALHADFFVKEFSDRLRLDLAEIVLVLVHGDVDDAVVRDCAALDQGDQFPELVSDLVVEAEDRVAGACVCMAAHKRIGDQIAGVIDHEARRRGRFQSLGDLHIAVGVVGLKGAAERQRLSFHVDDSEPVRSEIAEGRRLSGAGFSDDKNWDSH